MTPGEGASASTDLESAREALRDARLLLDGGSRFGVANRLYYTVFHAARAMLTTQGRHARTHSGQIAMYRQLFGNEPLLGQLFELRSMADYEPGRFDASDERLRALTQEVGTFLERCQSAAAEAIENGPHESDPPPDR